MFEPPTVLDAPGLLDKAFRRAARVTTRKGRTALERTRNLAVAKVQSASDVLLTTLEGYLKRFPSLDLLPPFERELIDATVGLRKLHTDLAALDWAVGRIRSLSREFPKQIQSASARDAIAAVRKAAFGRFSSIVRQVGPNLTHLGASRARLREIPQLDPEAPTIVVAGYPNVGKSLFVRSVSTAKPRVAPYPFTTKGVAVGHFDVGYVRFQILDTPGLLDRPMAKRNAMERQAITALSHVADAIVFILDPTETCGYGMDAQLRLLETVRDLFPGVPFLEVENKGDLAPAPGARPRMSAVTGDGVRAVLDAAIALVSARGPADAPPQGSA